MNSSSGGSANSAQPAHGDLKDVYDNFVGIVTKAREAHDPLNIVGGSTKTFYGRDPVGKPLETRAFSGIIDYEASELVVTVRTGTPLAEVEAVLAAEGQMLGFEPPHFGARGTIGGVVAAGLSGPRRPYGGAVRDAVLGVVVMSSHAERLRFGGQVMKNVAGYDVSRLMAGAMGTLGLLLEVSLRVAPQPHDERTMSWQVDEAGAHQRMIQLARHPWPLSAMSFDGELLRVRMSGHRDAVHDAEVSLAPEAIESAIHWHDLRDHKLPFFQSSEPLWRLSILPAAAPLPVAGTWLWDWGGACRWLKSADSAQRIRAAAQAAGGHATLFRGGAEDSPFTPLDPVSRRLHHRIKKIFDPDDIFNPGRMYAGF